MSQELKKKEPRLSRTYSKTLSLFAALLLLLSHQLPTSLEAQSYDSPSTIRIGVLAKRGEKRCLQKWQATADYLTEKLPQFRFRIVPLGFDAVYESVMNEDVQFVLANSSIYVELEHDFGVRRIATLRNLRMGKGYTRFGGTILTRKDNLEIREIEDLRGKVFAAVDPNSLGGWHAAWRELEDHNLTPKNDFAELAFTGTHDAVVHGVVAGKYDAGTVRTDTLERMASEGKINLADVHIPHAASEDKSEIPFLHSTRAYPEWPIAKLKNTPNHLAAAVAASLLQMPADSLAAKMAHIEGWTIPENYQVVRNTLEKLHIGPYKNLVAKSLQTTLEEYRLWLLSATFAFLLILCLGVIAFALSRRLSLALKKTKEEFNFRAAAERRVKDLNSLLQTLRDIDHLSAIEKDPKALVQKACETLTTVRGFHSAWIALLDENQKPKYFVSSGGGEGCQMLQEKFQRDALPRCSQEALERAEAIFPSAASTICQGCPIHKPARESHAMVSALRYRGQLYGLIGLSAPKELGEDKKERGLFEELSRDLAFALYTIDLEEKQREEKMELKAAKERAEASTQAKSFFLANMSHEIRTPMTAILGYIDALAEKETEPPKQELISIVRDNSEHLLDVINDILDYSKLEERKVTPQKEQCSPYALIEKVITMMKAQAHAKGLSFQASYCGALPEKIYTDPKLFSQMLINLMGNAMKFTKEGSVTVGVSYEPTLPKPTSFQVRVKDTGIGMHPSVVADIFAPFQQADNSTARNFGGTGLGLTISAEFARLLGGSLQVANTSLEQGTTMLLNIDPGNVKHQKLLSFEDYLRQQQSPHKAKGTQPAYQQLRSSYSILVAEDVATNQKLIRLILERAGATVSLAENGSEAVEKTLESTRMGNPFDIILMDMQMPVMDGYTATKTLRSHEITVPIIALTASALEQDKEKCLAAGCSAFAVKPIDRRKLLALIDEYAAKGQAVGPL